MKTYRLKLTTLTPVHIGTGEVYEPTNFVIDNGYLYEFDEYKFVSKLSKQDKQLLSNLNELSKIYKFFKDRKKLAINISDNRIKISKDIENIYRFIEKPRKNFKTGQIMLNKSKKPVYNQMNILKTIKSVNFNSPLISGSSLKGVMQTFLNLNRKDSQKLIISDSIEKKANTQIGYMLRVHRNPLKKSKKQIPQMVEVISPNSIFEVNLKYKDIQEIINRANSFYTSANKILYEDIKNKYVKNKNQFILRVGKYVGKEFIVRKIKKLPVTKSIFSMNKNKNNGGDDFGWILCEII